MNLTEMEIIQRVFDELYRLKKEGHLETDSHITKIVELLSLLR